MVSSNTSDIQKWTSPGDFDNFLQAQKPSEVLELTIPPLLRKFFEMVKKPETTPTFFVKKKRKHKTHIQVFAIYEMNSIFRNPNFSDEQTNSKFLKAK